MSHSFQDFFGRLSLEDYPYRDILDTDIKTYQNLMILIPSLGLVAARRTLGRCEAFEHRARPIELTNSFKWLKAHESTCFHFLGELLLAHTGILFFCDFVDTLVPSKKKRSKGSLRILFRRYLKSGQIPIIQIIQIVQKKFFILRTWI